MATSSTARPGVSRRRLAQAVGWSVPVIAVAAAAPALAASPVGAIVFEYYDVSPSAYDGTGRPTKLTCSLSIGNTGGPSPTTITSIVVTAVFPTARVTAAAPTAVGGTGWAYQSMSTSGGLHSFVFVWTGALLPFTSTSQLRFDVALADNSPGSVTSTVNALASGGSTATFTTTRPI